MLDHAARKGGLVFAGGDGLGGLEPFEHPREALGDSSRGFLCGKRVDEVGNDDDRCRPQSDEDAEGFLIALVTPLVDGLLLCLLLFEPAPDLLLLLKGVAVVL